MIVCICMIRCDGSVLISNLDSNAIGMGLFILYLIIKSYRNEAFIDEELSKLLTKRRFKNEVSWDDDVHLSSTMESFVNFLEVILAVVSVVNTVYLFNKSRSYTLFHQPTEVSFIETMHLES
jgi:hypothetical protein